MELTVHTLSCPVRSGVEQFMYCQIMEGQFMYCQIMGLTVHVLSDHGNDSSCTVRSWD